MGDVVGGLWAVLRGVEGWGMANLGRHLGGLGVGEAEDMDMKRWCVEDGQLVIRVRNETYVRMNIPLFPRVT